MANILWLFKKIIAILKEYCLSSSLAGIRYIADVSYHPIERIFWLLCVAISFIGSYYLIGQYLETFQSNAISIVDESRDLLADFEFPSVAVCELGLVKQEYRGLIENLEKSIENTTLEYNYDVEDFLLKVSFPNMYSSGFPNAYCSDCDDCMKCPRNGYREFADLTLSSCPDLFVKCQWENLEFDCCKYFLPIETTAGKCYMINSIQKTKRNSENWLQMLVGYKNMNAELKLTFRRPVSMHILNEEEIPHVILTSMEFIQIQSGSNDIIKVHLQDMQNDPEVRNIDAKYRLCRFPDERDENSPFKYYSYSVCATDCLRNEQIKKCNCTHHNLAYDVDDKNLACNFEGLVCLDRYTLIVPNAKVMQPWHTEGFVCDCMQSCNEKELYVVERTLSTNEDETNQFVIGIQNLPYRQYRRMAVRGVLDVVVTIGGILSLFTGASILSAVELVYFFTIRIIGNVYLKWRKMQENQQEQIIGPGRPQRHRKQWIPYQHRRRNKRILKSIKLLANQLDKK